MSGAPACAPSDAAAFVRDAIARIPDGAIGCITVPAPVAALETLLRVRPDDAAALWAPPDGPAFAGVGVTVRLHLSELRATSAALWERIAQTVFPDAATPSMRLFGGFAFARGAANGPPWTAFGDGSFVLPRWRYARDGIAATLTVATTAGDDDAPAEAADLLRALAQPPARSHARPGVRAIESTLR